jgi:hypothetical protein
VSEPQPDRRLDEALRDPEFLLLLFEDGIVEGFNVNPEKEE